MIISAFEKGHSRTHEAGIVKKFALGPQPPLLLNEGLEAFFFENRAQR